MSSLEQALALIAASNAQSISVAVHDLHSGERVELRARESMHAASTMKLAVLLAAYRLRVELDRPVRVENCFTGIADGSPFAVDPKEDDDAWPYMQLGREVLVVITRGLEKKDEAATLVREVSRTVWRSLDWAR